MSSAHTFSHLSLFLVTTSEQIGEGVYGVYRKCSGSSVPPMNHTKPQLVLMTPKSHFTAPFLDLVSSLCDDG